MDEARRRTLHGRRRGKKLRAGQQSLLDTLLPRLLLALPADAARKIDLAQAFGGTLPTDGVWLEVGFGAGEHLVWQAEQHPGVGLIGCEPYMNGVAKCLAHIERTGASNLPVEAEVDARHGGDLIADLHRGVQFAARVWHHHRQCSSPRDAELD